MDQLVADQAAASTGDPVDNTTATAQQDAAETPSTVEDLYPDDATQPGEDGEADAGEDHGNDDHEEGEGEPVDDLPAIEAPHSWKAEDKAKWGDLPREAQEIISRRETEVARLITAKSEEAATAKNTVVEQAKTEIAQFREGQAAQLRQYAALFTPQPPDERLLYTGNQEDHLLYQQQEAAFRRAYAQQQQLQQAAQYEDAEAQRIRDEQDQAARTADNAKLREEWPEWFMDGEEGRKLQDNLKSIALEIGYPEELWGERNAADVLALRKVQSWKADAERWRSYDRNRRNGRGQFQPQRQLPPVTKPGGSAARGPQFNDPVKLLYPND